MLVDEAHQVTEKPTGHLFDTLYQKTTSLCDSGQVSPTLMIVL